MKHTLWCARPGTKKQNEEYSPSASFIHGDTGDSSPIRCTGGLIKNVMVKSVFVIGLTEAHNSF